MDSKQGIKGIICHTMRGERRDTLRWTPVPHLPAAKPEPFVNTESTQTEPQSAQIHVRDIPDAMRNRSVSLLAVGISAS